MKTQIIFATILALSFNVTAQKIAEKHDDEVIIKVEDGDLMGSLLIPKSKDPVPVMLLIPGSGPTDRNCNSTIGLYTNSFKYLAEGLYKEGIATLRVDKRVSGKSATTFSMDSFMKMKFDEFVRDAEKWIELLKDDPRFSEVIVAGHSQGSLVAMLAAQSKGADKFVSLSGPGRPIDSVMVDQFVAQLPEQKDTIQMFFDSLRANSYLNEAPAMIKMNVPKVAAAFFSNWIHYSPREEISKMSIPVLIVNGARDVQVPMEEAKILHKANPNSKIVIFDEMTHVLKDGPEERMANIQSYNKPDAPLSDGLVKEISSFILGTEKD